MRAETAQPSADFTAAGGTAPSTMLSAASEAQPRRLLVTLIGLFVRSDVHWISVAAIIRLMADLGVGAQAVRSSISRLKRRGTLVGTRRAGIAGYSPSEQLIATLAEGDHRIFDSPRATLADGWVTAVFSVPEEERKKRHALRSTLGQHGFGILAPGVWIAPGNVAGETPEVLRRRDLDKYVTVLHGHLLGHRQLDKMVAECWDLPELANQYRQFVSQYEPVAEAIAADGADDRAAFATHVPMVTAWRRLPYLDPGLPLDLLPDPWPGVRATELFHRLHHRLTGGAHRYAEAVIAER